MWYVSATGTLLRAPCKYICAVPFEPAVSLHTIIISVASQLLSFHRNDHFFAHVPVHPASSIWRPFSCPQSSSKGRFTICLSRIRFILYFSGRRQSICAKFDRKIWRQCRSVASITCIQHKINEEGSNMDRCTSVGGASKWHSCPPLSIPPTDVVRWTQRSSICRERPRRQKISSPIIYAPDFLPGASVQKRASHCTLSSGYLGRSNKKIEFL